MSKRLLDQITLVLGIDMPQPEVRLRPMSPQFDREKRWEGENLLRIGRIDGVEVVLPEGSISRNHAEVALTEQGWVVRDLGSTNGTFLNGVRLGRTGRPIRANDILQCGNVVLFVEEARDRPPDMNETPCGGIQVQAVAQQSLEEAAQQLALEVTRSTDPGQQLLGLLQAGQFLHVGDSLDGVLYRNLEKIVKSMRARRGAIVLVDSKTGTLHRRAIYPCSTVPEESAFFSSTLARRCIHSGQSLLCASVVNDAELLEAKSTIDTVMGSIICALLRSPRRYLGILHLDRGIADEPFTRDELRRADAFAASMSLAVEHAQNLQERQQNVLVQTVVAFSQIIELRDPATAGHAQRVTDYALLLADELHLSETDHDYLRIGAPLHDIGKIGIDDAVLRKTGKLTPEEFEYMKQHTVKGAALLRTLPGLDIVLPIVRNHHERWDGSGYPDRLAGTDIPFLARLMAVVDSFDAMTTNRPYRAGLPMEQALAEIERGVGSQFDPECARAFLATRLAVQKHLERQGTLAGTLREIHVDLTSDAPASDPWVSSDAVACHPQSLLVQTR
jgi:putative nucleotidyltransferase with HDIG domain